MTAFKYDLKLLLSFLVTGIFLPLHRALDLGLRLRWSRRVALRAGKRDIVVTNIGTGPGDSATSVGTCAGSSWCGGC